MAYKSLYRAYRPQTFQEVAGQKFIIQTLKNAINQDKIAHAYIFCGPRGTGKTSMAKLLAKGINCTSAKEKPCNTCENCQAINKNNHPDVIEIDAASNNGVDEIRDLIEKVKYAPLLGAKKVYIIDEVHMLSASAFNAFLKTLEEPPAHVVFILATTEPHKVIPTILSRCQRFDFQKVSINDIKRRIQEVLEAEKIKFDQETLSIVAELAEGGMRDALSIVDQTIAYAGEKISSDDVKEIYGVASTAEKIDFIHLIIQKDLSKSLLKLKAFDEKGTDLVRFSNDLIIILKDIIVFSYSKAIENLMVLNEKEALEFRKNLSTQDLLALIDILIEALDNYKKSSNVKSFLELAIFKMIEVMEHNKLVSNVEVTKKEEKSPIESKEEKVNQPKKIKAEDIGIIAKEKKNEDVVNLAEVIIKDEDIINILVQANKDKKNIITNRWQEIGSNYLSDPLTAQAAALLVDGKVFAASQNGLIVSYKRLPQLKIARQTANLTAIHQFINQWLSEEYIVYPISDEEVVKYKSIFVSASKAGTLPTPQPVRVLVEPSKNQSSINLKTIFGNFIKKGE